MPARLSFDAAEAMANALGGLFNAGSGAAKLEIRTGTQPTDPDASATGTLLCTFTLQDPAFGNASDVNPGAQLTLDNTPAITATAVGTGTAGYGRYLDSDDNAILDDEVGVGHIVLDNTSITTGQNVTLNSSTITLPQYGS